MEILIHAENDLHATERYDAIRELVGRLVDAGVISQHAQPALLAKLLTQEETMSSGIGFGIAGPEVRSDAVSKPILACALLRTGVEWESFDDKPVELILLIIRPYLWLAVEREFYRRLRPLVRALTDPAFREKLQNLPAQDIRAALEDVLNENDKVT